MSSRFPRLGDTKWTNNGLGWCHEPFGPLIQWQPWAQSLSKEPFRRWSCRLPKGHKGEHDCPAAEEFVDWNAGLGDRLILVEPYVRQDRKTKPKGRSSAARALFGRR